MKLNRKKITQYCSVFAVFGSLILGLNSCYDDKMEWGDPYTHPETKDLPLALKEAISRYDVLTAYTDITLGVGIDFNLYMTDEAYRNIINENFKEVVAGNEMKQSSLLDATGALDAKRLERLDLVMEALQNAGLSVYGHTLVWHSQQRADYLNSLIKVAANMIASSNFEEFEAGANADVLYGGGWNSWGGSASPTREVSANGGGYDGYDGAASKALIIHSKGGGVDYAVQATTNFTAAFVVGRKYHVEAMMKSSVEKGSVRIQFQGGSATYLSADEVGTSWIKVAHDFTATNANNKIMFDLGEVDADYYIDNVLVFELEAVNIIPNGSFEEFEAGANGDALYGGGWNSWGGSSSREVSAEGEGYGGGKGKALIIHSIGGVDDYSVQATTNLPKAFTIGHRYHVEAMMKSSVANGSVRIQFQGGSATYLPTDEVGTSWTKIEHDFKAANNNNKIVFDLGKVSADYYIDNIIIYDLTAIATNEGVIPMPHDQKAEKIEKALLQYVSQVVSHFQGKVTAWDVVNEPMGDNGTVRPGEEDLTSTDHFYWQYYLGENYAVTAFKTARTADPDAKLFINDYGLESPAGAKLQGLIDYVQRIESQGATVDGIGTQMHLNINWADKDGIENMFKALGATGKLIKISELDIAIDKSSGTSSPPGSAISPTLEQYAQQAELYQFVVDMYMKHIPEAQRYGITLWGVSDNEKEHEYWLKNDAPCLWDAKYQRKHAYKGFADGLAGKDVSAEFSGELQY